jgi:PAS domain S-box-containing protein
VLTAGVLLIAGSNLLVWIVGLGNSPHVSMMRFNAALALTACGISLWLSRDENAAPISAAVASALGLFASLIGTLTALQYFTGWDLHIDELFKRQRLDAAGTFTSHPGRMSLNAALTLVGAGLSLALLDVRWHWRKANSMTFAPGLAIVSALPTLAAFVGYAIGIGYLTGILGSTNMLLHTAVAQLALCAAILAARPDRQPMRLMLSRGPAGLLLRWLGPATVVMLLGLGWIVHRGQRAQVYGANDALALMILLGLLLLSSLLFGTAVALGRIEERRAGAAAAVREQEERFRMLADNISQLAWMADATGSIFWYNKRWFEYTGTTAEQVTGWGWKIVHDPEHVQRVADGFAHAVAAGEQWEDTFPLRGRAGEWRWFLSRALPMRDDAGRVVGWFGTNTDITEQRAAADALTAAKEAAEGANRAKDEFLAALSHELRTPLTPVLMTAEELCDDPALSPEIRDQLCMVRRNIRLEARLIDDLLDLTRAAHGKFGLRRAACDLQMVGREALEVVREEAAGRSVVLTEELDRSPAWLEGDCTRIEQVLWNLLRNAVKFTPSGGRVTLRTRIDREEGRWIAEVEDTGIGISAEVLPRLFKPFEQGGLVNNHRFGGLGLGLAISKTIVEMHGGTIEAHSGGVNCGATFKVSLGPLRPSPAAAAPAGDSRQPAKSARGPMRLLLVEDHAPTRAVLSRLLRRGGHTVTEAGDVSSALAAAAEANGEFDALVSDIGLPDGSGQDLMAELRKSYGMRGIAVSGYGTEEDLRRSSDSGFAAHLTKPVEFAQLREALSRFG